MRDYYPQSAVMHSSNGGSSLHLTAYFCASKLARSSARRSNNSLLKPWLHCPFTRESCDKNVIMPFALKWPAGGGQNRKQAEPEFFHLSEVDFVKGEILALLTCTWIRVGKSRPPNVTEISSLIATGCSCF